MTVLDSNIWKTDFVTTIKGGNLFSVVAFGYLSF